MCGIIGAFNFKDNKKNVNDFVINQYQDQISRGKEGFGAVFIKKDGSYIVKRATHDSKILLDLYLNKAKMIIFHHRYPTSSENKLSQTHPMVISNGSLKHNYMVIHNGVIHNDDEMREEHEKLGFTYKTPRLKKNYYNETYEYNDSEVVAIEIARFIEGQTDIIKSRGSFALIIAQIDKKTDKITNILFTRHNNPLNLSKTKDKMRLSSEGEGSEIKEDVLYSCSIKSFKLSKKPLKVDSYQITKTYSCHHSSDDDKFDEDKAGNFIGSEDDDKEKNKNEKDDIGFNDDDKIDLTELEVNATNLSDEIMGIIDDFNELICGENDIISHDKRETIELYINQIKDDMEQAWDSNKDIVTNDIVYNYHPKE